MIAAGFAYSAILVAIPVGFSQIIATRYTARILPRVIKNWRLISAVSFNLVALIIGIIGALKTDNRLGWEIFANTALWVIVGFVSLLLGLGALIWLLIDYSKYGNPDVLVKTAIGNRLWDNIIDYALVGIEVLRKPYFIDDKRRLIKRESRPIESGGFEVIEKVIPIEEYDRYLKKYIKYNKKTPWIDDPVSGITSVIFSFIDSNDKQAFEDALTKYSRVFQDGFRRGIPISAFLHLEPYIIENAYKHLEEIVEVLQNKNLDTWLDRPVNAMAGIALKLFVHNEPNSVDVALNYYKDIGNRFIIRKATAGINSVIDSLRVLLEIGYAPNIRIGFDAACEVLGGFGERIPVFWRTKAEVESLVLGDVSPYFSKYNPLNKLIAALDAASSKVFTDTLNPLPVLNASSVTLTSVLDNYDRSVEIPVLLHYMMMSQIVILLRLDVNERWPIYVGDIIRTLNECYTKSKLFDFDYFKIREYIAMSYAKACVVCIEKNIVYPAGTFPGDIVDDLINDGLAATDPNYFPLIARGILTAGIFGNPSYESRREFVSRFTNRFGF